jgi:hypothetical protein
MPPILVTVSLAGLGQATADVELVCMLFTIKKIDIFLPESLTECIQCLFRTLLAFTLYHGVYKMYMYIPIVYKEHCFTAWVIQYTLAGSDTY